MQDLARNATLDDLATLLKSQHARKVDVVAPSGSIRSVGGDLLIQDTVPMITEDGVTNTAGVYTPTSVCDEGIADKLKIPIAYLRRMRQDAPAIYDDNVNGWLQRDRRSFLVRCYRADESGEGVARAFLSDSYKVVDNLDVLTASLDGIADAGVNVTIDGCDLTDRKMYVRVIAPEMQVMAERLLKDYRNPFGDDFERWRRMADREGLGFGQGAEPIVFAGFILTNSETGGGAFTIVPRFVIKVCKNGLTITKDALRKVHLGGRLEEGVIRWSDETQEKSLDLVRLQTRDAVQTFLSEEYMTSAIEALEEDAAKTVDGVEEVKVLTKSLAFSTEHTDSILNRFIRGGQMTRGGVMNAITATAQTIEDADLAHKMESEALKVLA